MDVKQLNEAADTLFTNKQPLTSLHQELADNFYPERADFTVTRSMGSDFAAHLMSSYPIQCRRDLGNQFGAMLRPTAKPWFKTVRKHEPFDNESVEVQAYLQWFTRTQRRAMYDTQALLTRATKEGDHDFAAFGQTVIGIELNREANGLLYRCWHLRDVAWEEDDEGKIGFVVRKAKMKAHVLVKKFKDKCHQKVKDLAAKDPFAEIECRHFVAPAEMYDGTTPEPRWSIWYDVQNAHIMEDIGIRGRCYRIPRWQTVSGSQYSYSPATVCALPDARLLQAMTFTLLEAGEKATSPPMVAVKNVIKSDMSLYAGGVTWVDQEYDERLGAALRPIEQDFRGFNFGLTMNQDTRQVLAEAFYLNRLRLPVRAPEMTAYEVGQRVQEWIRDALPIFEPMEMEYNAALCEESFELMLQANAFGDPRSWPKQLRGAEIDFAFESPLHDAIDQQKGQQFTQANQLIAEAMALDPSVAFLPKTEVALRDALSGIGIPAKWMHDEAYVAEQQANAKRQAEMESKLAALQQASEATKNLGQSGLLPQLQGA